MNAPFVRWLLGIEAAPDELSGARIIFERPLPGWGWFFVITAGLLIAWWSYTRLRGVTRWRVTLGAMRTFLLLFIAVLVAGPALRIAHETVEEDWVLVLADRSRSMSIRDASDASSDGRTTRDEALRGALKRSDATWKLLDDERMLVWLGFAGGAFDLAPSNSGTIEETIAGLGDASGDRTLLDDALNQAMQRAAARPIAGIVIMTDGRTTAAPSRATLRRLQAAAARVFVVPLGSTESTGDIAITKVDAPRRAFVRDEVPVNVEIERTGNDRTQVPTTVRLLDAVTGERLAELEVPALAPGATSVSVTLIAKTAEIGQRDWRVELDAGPADLVAENNTRSLQVELVDRPLRVLYIDGYPRWEYRFLKNLLVREETIESAVLLLSADRDFAQEGNLPISRLPRTKEEFSQFDLIIIGDVPAGFFTPEQLEIVRDQVAQRGTGLMWVGGERATPKAWDGSALADLLPMRGPLNLPMIDAPVNMVATPAASALGLLKLGEGTGWPSELADPSVGWSRLEWAQQIPAEQLKPTAETLAVGVPSLERNSDTARPIPLIISMKYGAGEIIYVATDEIWRWRYGRGERYTEQVWLPLVRMLGREALAGGGDAAMLRAVPARVQLGQSVRLELVLSDSRLVDRGDTVMPVQVSLAGDTASTAATEIELMRTPRAGEFAASLTPDAVGSYVVRVPSGPAAGAEVQFECDRPDDETRRASADHALLADLAKETGGAVVQPEDLDSLPDLLPNRRVTTETATIEPLWDAPLALILILLVATMEWLGRRWMRLA
ncbi:MAG: hypothetical protein SGJ11_13800 [Phycisphaerae bacterium]|nr:hypothetical protein [Phycisphaerae bacterium]